MNDHWRNGCKSWTTYNQKGKSTEITFLGIHLKYFKCPLNKMLQLHNMVATQRGKLIFFLRGCWSKLQFEITSFKPSIHFHFRKNTGLCFTSERAVCLKIMAPVATAMLSININIMQAYTNTFYPIHGSSHNTFCILSTGAGNKNK